MKQNKTKILESKNHNREKMRPFCATHRRCILNNIIMRIFLHFLLNLFLFSIQNAFILLVCEHCLSKQNVSQLTRPLLLLFLVQFSLFLFFLQRTSIYDVNTLFYFHYAICRMSIAKEGYRFECVIPVFVTKLMYLWCIYWSYVLTI